MAMNKDILGAAIRAKIEAWRSSEGYRVMTPAEAAAVEDLWTRIADAFIDHMKNYAEQTGRTQDYTGDPTHSHAHDGPNAGIK